MSSKVKIYTKTGDKGLTSLYGGKRVSKSDPQVNGYGSVDELNSVIGILLSELEKNHKVSALLKNVQEDLFTIGAHLAGGKASFNFIGPRISQMEKMIDELDRDLPQLKNFILPGGTKEASLAHFVRTVGRRTEREVVKLYKDSDFPDSRVLIYLNRFSDLMFIIARFLNNQAGLKDYIWKSII